MVTTIVPSEDELTTLLARLELHIGRGEWPIAKRILERAEKEVLERIRDSGAESVLKIPIPDVPGFDIRLVNALEEREITTVGMLLNTSEEEFRAIPNLGDKNYHNARGALLRLLNDRGISSESFIFLQSRHPVFEGDGKADPGEEP